MRSKRESTIFEEKNFISEDETVQTQAACLNRIFRKVNSTGLSADTIQELRDDIDYVAERYHIDNQGAVLLAAILEKSATNNLIQYNQAFVDAVRATGGNNTQRVLVAPLSRTSPLPA